MNSGSTAADARDELRGGERAAAELEEVGILVRGADAEDGDPLLGEPRRGARQVGVRGIRIDQRQSAKKNGELIFVELTGRRVGENLFQGIYRDITERKLAEEELKRSEERFRAIFEGAKDFIFIKDLSLRYTHVNPATAKLLGVPASEILGKTAEDFFKKEAAQYIKETDARVLKGERIEEICTREIRGVPMTFHEVRIPMHNELRRDHRGLWNIRET